MTITDLHWESGIRHRIYLVMREELGTESQAAVFGEHVVRTFIVLHVENSVDKMCH